MSFFAQSILYTRCPTTFNPYSVQDVLLRVTHTYIHQTALEHPLIIWPVSFNLTLQQDNYDPHPTSEPLSPLVSTQKRLAREHFLSLAHLLGTICLTHSATLILPPLSKAALISISKQFFTAVPTSDVCVCVCVCVRACVREWVRACVRVCVCVVVVVVIVIVVVVKRPALPPCVVDGRSRNPLYYYYVISITRCPITCGTYCIE